MNHERKGEFREEAKVESPHLALWKSCESDVGASTKHPQFSLALAASFGENPPSLPAMRADSPDDVGG
jgi:hypothetical protein